MSVSQTPTRISAREDRGRVRIEWEDGAQTDYSAAQLRRLCPCAQCVNEMTGRRMLDPTSVPDDLTQTEVELVGQYAIALRFSDGHSTGIFTFAYLRANDPAGA